MTRVGKFSPPTAFNGNLGLVRVTVDTQKSPYHV